MTFFSEPFAPAKFQELDSINAGEPSKVNSDPVNITPNQPFPSTYSFKSVNLNLDVLSDVSIDSPLKQGILYVLEEHYGNFRSLNTSIKGGTVVLIKQTYQE